MATQANTYLVITDGTTTVTFEDGSGGASSYRIAEHGWTPAVAGLRRGQLGGAGPYEEVIEEMEVNISGADVATAYANLDTLNRLLDFSERWYRGEISAILTPAVEIKYAPKGSTTASTATPYHALIYGRPPGESIGPTQFTPEWNDVLGKFVIKSVRVRFVRDGLWLCGSETSTPAAANNGQAVQASLTARNIASPTSISWTNAIIDENDTTNNVYGHGGYLICADNVSGTSVVSSSALVPATAGAWTAPAETGVTTVQRYTPAGTTEVLTPSGVVFTLPTVTEGALWAVFISARNNSATTTFKARIIETVSGSVTPIGNYGPYISFAPNATPYPLWTFMGIIPILRSSAFSIGVTASAAAGTFDMDSIFFARVSSPGVYIIKVGPRSYAGTINPIGITIDSKKVVLTITQKPTATIYRTTAENEQIPYSGDISIYTRGAGPICYWLATGGANTAVSPGNYFVQYNVTGAATYQNTFTFTRYPAYLSPV